MVTFKAETIAVGGQDAGPVSVVDVAAMRADPNLDGALGMPYGYRPPWREDLGWLTRSQAEREAQTRGVALTET